MTPGNGPKAGASSWGRQDSCPRSPPGSWGRNIPSSWVGTLVGVVAGERDFGASDHMRAGSRLAARGLLGLLGLLGPQGGG